MRAAAFDAKSCATRRLSVGSMKSKGRASRQPTLIAHRLDFISQLLARQLCHSPPILLADLDLEAHVAHERQHL
jgi:hypothetical protein